MMTVRTALSLQVASSLALLVSTEASDTPLTPNSADSSGMEPSLLVPSSITATPQPSSPSNLLLDNPQATLVAFVLEVVDLAVDLATLAVLILVLLIALRLLLCLRKHERGLKLDTATEKGEVITKEEPKRVTSPPALTPVTSQPLIGELDIALRKRSMRQLSQASGIQSPGPATPLQEETKLVKEKGEQDSDKTAQDKAIVAVPSSISLTPDKPVLEASAKGTKDDSTLSEASTTKAKGASDDSAKKTKKDKKITFKFKKSSSEDKVMKRIEDEVAEPVAIDENPELVQLLKMTPIEENEEQVTEL